MYSELKRELEKSRNIEEKVKAIDSSMNRIADYWMLNCIEPYCLAFNHAFLSFKEITGRQKELDSEKGYYLFQALSLIPGCFLLKACSESTLKLALPKLISNSKNRKLCHLSYSVQQNSFAKFILGKFYDEGIVLLNDKMKATLTPAENEKDEKQQDPLSVFILFDMFIRACNIKTVEAAQAIRDQKGLSEEQRNVKIDKLVQSRYLDPPLDKLFNDDEKKDQIELFFYLQIVMGLDYLRNDKINNENIISSYQSINMSPSSPQYPKDKIIRAGIGNYESEYVVYEDLGEALYNQINLLSKKRYNQELLKSKKFGEYWNYTIDKKSFEACSLMHERLKTASEMNYMQERSRY